MSNRIEFSANGQGKASKATKTAKAPRPTKAETAERAARALLRRRIAAGIGGIGVSVLALSVVHCTEGISLLTGSPWYLSALLAIGVDAGMVGCELAELIGDERALKLWARAYIGLSIALSMGLNAYAFGLHATIPAAGAALGLVVPVLVLALGRVAGHLAK
jgi:hypothetical protein